MINLKRMERLAVRVVRLASRPNQHSIIAIIGEQTVSAANGFLNSLKNVEQMEAKNQKELNESVLSLQPLAKEYDNARLAVKVKVPNEPVGAVSSQYNVHDDLLNACENLEDTINVYAEEQWAKDLLQTLSPLIDAANKEWAESIQAGDDLQKAKQNRRDMSQRFLNSLIEFRRAIRQVYGRTSREYKSLILRLAQGETDTELPEETGTAVSSNS